MNISERTSPLIASSKRRVPNPLLYFDARDAHNDGSGRCDTLTDRISGKVVSCTGTGTQRLAIDASTYTNQTLQCTVGSQNQQGLYSSNVGGSDSFYNAFQGSVPMSAVVRMATGDTIQGSTFAFHAGPSGGTTFIRLDTTSTSIRAIRNAGTTTFTGTVTAGVMATYAFTFDGVSTTTIYRNGVLLTTTGTSGTASAIDFLGLVNTNVGQAACKKGYYGAWKFWNVALSARQHLAVHTALALIWP